MRIVVVSAHYPPNFVSGGTLQAQRVARGLRDRGHDVSVYAGWFGKDRPTMQTWDETDPTGLPLRWVVTTPWTLWDDDHNWANPEVAADFAAYLADARPDVVHLHSLQSLGAGMLREARRSGARVVLTMHDFWFVCARQFLVDRGFQPCCLVVDAGVCACERDRPWLESRNRALRNALDDVDLVLAPSASAARLLAANGVDPRRLVVDENGLPDRALHQGPSGPSERGAQGPSGPSERGAQGPSGPSERGAQGPSRPLNFLYVGGPNPLKGVHVLLQAARALGHRAGWRLVAHDAGHYVETSGFSVDGLPVELAPPFDPASADRVYEHADVLVIPSVMRESFSLVAREALMRGVPVVCTDTLGPEEVVQHGRNGLVVPAADHVALARVIERLLDEPDLLPRLRAGCGDVSVRGLDEQLDGLESTFAALIEESRASSGDPEAAVASPVPVISVPENAVRRVLFVCGIDGAPLRYRARMPAESLALLGVSSDVVHYRDPELAELAARAHAVVFYRVPATHQVLDLIDGVRARGTPTFFDVDDLIFDPEIAPEIPALELLPAPEADLWMEGVRRYRTTMEACDVYIGSTGPLCRHAASVTGLPAERFDNGVGKLVAQLSDRALAAARRPGPLRIGYLSGTRTHDLDWLSIEPAVVDVLGRHEDLDLWLVGHVNISPALERLGPRVRRQPFRPWHELPPLLRDLDVNLAPLVLGSRFNEAKSPVKWLEASQTETPTIATPTEPLLDVVRNGDNGVLATDPEDWVDALEHLLAEPEHRARMGRRARRSALLQFSPHLQGRRYLDILERVPDDPARHGERAAARAPWTGVALDEPPLRLALEPYRAGLDFPGGVTDPASRLFSARARRLAGRGWTCLRTEGTAATARKVAGYSARQYQVRVRPMVRDLGRRWRRRALSRRR